ncbi:DUF624 domain-containing protein [Halalkalibacillus halophilus]|uniref:DUF624 domain-containing protein n=1 Tax=Halalkalibacillus halophilus TaxID=392827 RepID=UPI000411C99B|nr:DUF624 domain-containing protein [Halalkalibacillus halophilus]
MNRNGLSGWIVSLSKWIAKLTTTNIMWFLINLPTWFVFYSWVTSEQKLALIHFILFILVMTFLFFPSTRAMFMSLRYWIMEQDDKDQRTHYLRTLIKNYRKFLKTNVLFSVIWLIWIIDLYIVYGISDSLFAAFVVIGVLLYGAQMIYFCLESHFEMSTMEKLKYAALGVVGSPFLTAYIIVISAMVTYITVVHFLALLPFVSGVIIAFLSLLMFHHWADRLKVKAIKKRK